MFGIRPLSNLQRCIVQTGFSVFKVVLVFFLCFQLEKYQDVIKATEEFEAKLVSIGVCPCFSLALQ